MPGNRAASLSRCSASGSTTRKSRAAAPRAEQPPMSAVAMLPPPMNVSSCPSLERVARVAVASPRAEDRGARRARASRPRRSRPRGRPTCPSTACRRQARGAAARRSTRAARGTARAARAVSAVGSGMPMIPRSRSRGSAATACASATRLGRRDAALRRLAADVDLHADVERRQRRPAARADSRSRDLHPVDALHPVETSPRPAAPCCSAAGRSGATRCRRGRRARAIFAAASCT